MRLLPIMMVLQACSIVLVDEPCDTGADLVDEDTGAPAELRFRAVGTGATHSCGIRDTGELLCWGLNDDGQLDVPAGAFTQLTVGHAHACALDADGAAQCWGRNDQSQADLSGIFVAVSAGGAHTCGLDAEGQITCVGRNDEGQLEAPEGRFQQVAAGATHTCGVTDPDGDGPPSLVCWGGLSSDGVGRSIVRSVISGTDWSCAVLDDAEEAVSCVGESGAGQHAVPRDLDLSTAVAGARHGCGLNDAGVSECWGADDAGQLGAPDEAFLALGSGPTSLHTCGIVDDGGEDDGPVQCWGLGAENQLTP